MTSTIKSVNYILCFMNSHTTEIFSFQYQPADIYEAGPCGFTLYRHLTGNGFRCIVAAPSVVPKKTGVRIKNDTRDAIALARLLRAGELTSIYVPDTEDEAMRDVTRARNDARIVAQKAKQRLHSFLLRNEFIYRGKKKWTKAHYNWLAHLKMIHPAQQVAFQEYIDAGIRFNFLIYNEVEISRTYP